MIESREQAGSISVQSLVCMLGWSLIMIWGLNSDLKWKFHLLYQSF